MGFSLGGSVSKGKSSGTETYDKNMTGTTTGTAPDWLSEYLKGITGKTVELGGAAPSDFVAGADPLQKLAAGRAGDLMGSSWNFDGAADLTRGVAAAATPTTRGVQASGYVGDYLNPYLKDVVDATSADMDVNDGRTRAQQDLELAGSGAFGGSGAALTKSMTEGELARSRAAALGGLRSHAYDASLSAADADANRQQSAKNLNAQLLGQGQDRTLQSASQLAGLSSAYDANSRANVATQSGLGDQMRQIAQQFAGAPLELQTWVNQNLPDLLQGLFGKTEVGTEAGKSATTGKSSGFSFGGSVTGGK